MSSEKTMVLYAVLGYLRVKNIEQHLQRSNKTKGLLICDVKGSLRSSSKEELQCLGQQGKSRCALDSVLSNLCQAHRSLLYQILKLANQEKLLTFINCRPVGQTYSHCNHSGMDPQTTVTPLSFELDRDHCSTVHSPDDSKSCQNIYQCPFKDYKHKEEQSSSCSCVQRCRRETYADVCSKRVHCHYCQNCVNGCTVRMSSFEPSPSLSSSPVHCALPSGLSLSPPICCWQHSHTCHLHSIQISSIQTLSVGEREVEKRDPPHLVLKREQSPSPPPLSPIYSEIVKKTDGKQPSLLNHEKREQADSVNKDDIVHANQDHHLDLATESSQAELNQSGTSLQDLMKRFSEKLETIKPSDKDPNLFSTAIYVSEEQLQSPTTSQNLHFHPDAHLTEIITTVLHTGCTSDYSLSELFNHHQNNELKSPNTRSRHRQEVLAAIAKPTDDASTRRHSLQIKRELAMLDQSCNKRKKKRAHVKDTSVTETVSSVQSEPIFVTQESETGNNGVILEKSEVISESFSNSFSEEIDRKDLKEECQVVAEVQHIKAEMNKSELSNEETKHKATPRLHCNCGKCTSEGDHLEAQEITMISNVEKQSRIPLHIPREHRSHENTMNHDDSSVVHSGSNKNRTDKDHSLVWKRHKYASNYSKGERRLRRKIVPPQRFSSYVTEPKNTFFVACFSEGVFNRGVQKEKNLLSSAMQTTSIDSKQNGNQSDSENMEYLPSFDSTKGIINENEQKEQLETFPEHFKDQEDCFSKAVAADELNPEKHSPRRTDRRGKFMVDDANVMPVGRLRSFTRKLQAVKTEDSSSDLNISISSTTSIGATLPDTEGNYTSPIKLMFVSPVKDANGLRYSLKSGSQTEHFDPCEESSWSGTPYRHRGPSKNFVASPVNSSMSSTLKSDSPCPTPTFSSQKRLTFPNCQFSSSPIKSTCLLRSATSLPKDNSRSGEESPSKQNHKSELGTSPTFHGTSPTKRRPGRPKKLGPPLEQKLKKPIGRPRKENNVASVPKATSANENSFLPSGMGQFETKNLKITVMCGRSRSSKRTVLECIDKLQTELNHVKQPVDNPMYFGNLLHNPSTSSGIIPKNPEELNIFSSKKETPSQVTCSAKYQDGLIPSRKPGRPPKIKISGISVTITMSPWHRRIKFNEDNYHPPETKIQKKVILKSNRNSQMIHPPLSCDQKEAEKVMDTTSKIKEERSNHPVALRHSLRVRKPSIHFLRAVATSTFRSYSRSSALLRRSKQLLLNKANNERRLEEQHTHAELTEVAKQVCGKERSSLPDLSGVAEVSVGPIFAPKETLKWWAASAEEEEMNQELARRIRIFSDTWIIDTVENKEKETAPKVVKPLKRTSKHNSVVRTLFDCPPDKPSSCSRHQISSWFMQTTETQSLAIVKKATSRHHYDPAQFSRSTNKIVVCPSPQAERLRKHVKKFAKTVPKSPLEHQAARKRPKVYKPALLTLNVRRRLFPLTLQSTTWWRRISTAGKLQIVLSRARNRFLTLNERKKKKWIDEKNRNAEHLLSCRNINSPQAKQNASWKTTKGQYSNCMKSRPSIRAVGQTHPMKVNKEPRLTAKALQPEMLKECRVSLKKINYPVHRLAEDLLDSHNLGEGSSSPYKLAESKIKSKGAVQVGKTERKLRLKNVASRQVERSLSKTAQEWDKPLKPPPARLLRQSRTRRLTGPKWSDFVFDNYLALFD